MIQYIRGILAAKTDREIIIEAGGIGYRLYVPSNSTFYQRCDGEEIKAFVNMIVREDDVSLYGFSDMESLDMFNLLIKINGVGAKAAMAIMSVMPVVQLKQAIALEDTGLITKANGVGKKIAQRIVLELKDKVGDVDLSNPEAVIDSTTGGSRAVAATDERAEAINGLVALGYTKAEAISAMSVVTDDGLSADQYLRQALKNLF